jgi:hypothetical protein
MCHYASVTILCDILLSVATLNVTMLSVIILCDILLSVAMLNVAVLVSQC